MHSNLIGNVALVLCYVVGVVAAANTLWMMYRHPQIRHSAVADTQPYEGFNEVRDRRRSKR